MMKSRAFIQWEMILWLFFVRPSYVTSCRLPKLALQLQARPCVKKHDDRRCNPSHIFFSLNMCLEISTCRCNSSHTVHPIKSNCICTYATVPSIQIDRRCNRKLWLSCLAEHPCTWEAKRTEARSCQLSLPCSNEKHGIRRCNSFADLSVLLKESRFKDLHK